MGRVVEITIDLSNPNGPKIETFEITKVCERHIYAKSIWGQGRCFFIPNMNEVKYRGLLKYTYRYRTEETDYVAIVESTKTAEAIKAIVRYLTNDINCYQRRLKSCADYYGKEQVL